MTRAAAAAFVLTLMLNGAASAQQDERIQPGGTPGGLFKGSQEEQAACQPDATRYCLDEMPDNLRVLACLQQHREKLRKVCLKVLEAHGQ